MDPKETIIPCYCGSFDPPTVGHIELIRMTYNIFGTILIGIGQNEDKTRRFSPYLMQESLKKALQDLNIENAVVEVYDGFTYQFAKDHKATLLIRGIRNYEDLTFEREVEKFNLEHGLETKYFHLNKFKNVSSTYVMKLLEEGNKKAYDLLPPAVSEAVKSVLFTQTESKDK